MPEVVAVKRRDSREFVPLVESLGYDILRVVEFRDARNPRYYISLGKVEEIKGIEERYDMVVIDGVLKSSQWYHLEKELGRDVKDKVGIIIEIFADRAKSREALLQVEYARLKYEIPLVREVIHHIRMGEHAGWKGSGEYEVSDYYEMIRRRMARIKRELEEIRREREERRKRRRREGFVLVGIAGYTNSGKSTLLNALTQTGRIVEDRMFSTLATKTSRLDRERILITDTVGFVEDMPPWLISAFEPTLEEIYSSDVILLLLDGSDETSEFRRKMNVTLDIIANRAQGKIIPVINKVDVASDIEEKIRIAGEIGKPVVISAKEKRGLDELVRRIMEESGIEEYVMDVDDINGEEMKYIRRFGRILDIQEGERIKVKFLMRRQFYESFFARMNSTGSGG